MTKNIGSSLPGNAGDPGLPLHCPRTVTRPPAVAQ